MFFILSKTVAFLLLPSNFLLHSWACGRGAAGDALETRRPARWSSVPSFCSQSSGFCPVGTSSSTRSKAAFRSGTAARGAPDGIIVLGGAISPKLSKAFGEPVFNGSASRMLAMAKLARAYPNARIVYSGGDASLFGNGVREADFVYPALESLGVARERVKLETQSRNTAENAAFTKLLVKPKPGERWLLVTSAQHMPRAIGCFRKADFHVEAYPVGWWAADALDVQWGRGLANGLERLDAAAYEWIGLLAYRLSGRTAELFPSP